MKMTVQVEPKDEKLQSEKNIKGADTVMRLISFENLNFAS